MPVTVRRVEALGAPYAADFLVDTGATDCLAPARELERIGIAPAGRMAYELADGSRHEYVFGLARIEFMGEVTAGRILFGPDEAEPLLGVTALESVGITVDPATGTLKRLPAIPLKRLAGDGREVVCPCVSYARAAEWPTTLWPEAARSLPGGSSAMTPPGSPARSQSIMAR